MSCMQFFILEQAEKKQGEQKMSVESKEHKRLKAQAKDFLISKGITAIECGVCSNDKAKYLKKHCFEFFHFDYSPSHRKIIQIKPETWEMLNKVRADMIKSGKNFTPTMDDAIWELKTK